MIMNPITFNPPLGRLDKLTFTFYDRTNNVIDNSSRPLLSISTPASSLEGSMDAIIKQLEGIKSKKVYTI